MFGGEQGTAMRGMCSKDDPTISLLWRIVDTFYDLIYQPALHTVDSCINKNQFKGKKSLTIPKGLNKPKYKLLKKLGIFSFGVKFQDAPKCSITFPGELRDVSFNI